jgi:hypothetical protein
MQSNYSSSELDLSIIVTVVGGKELVGRSLSALCSQLNFATAEVIVPYDSWAVDVGDLAEEFPQVRFHFINDIGAASSSPVTSRQHRLYDRRRAVGLSLARGRLIAMTEDYAVPAEDWCRQVCRAHEQPYPVIGGAIENGVDEPLNWALYYCDFGRYGKPFVPGEASYVSDVNIAYKREALDAIREVWRGVYHETTVHWTLRSRGQSLFLDPRMVIYQHRPKITVFQALRERVEWGRIFAETRVAKCSSCLRIVYAAGSLLLPPLLLIRVLRNMLRQRQTLGRVVQTLPLAACLVVGTALGEFLGYLGGEPRAEVSLSETASEV